MEVEFDPKLIDVKLEPEVSLEPELMLDREVMFQPEEILKSEVKSEPITDGDECTADPLSLNEQQIPRETVPSISTEGRSSSTLQDDLSSSMENNRIETLSPKNLISNTRTTRKRKQTFEVRSEPSSIPESSHRQQTMSHLLSLRHLQMQIPKKISRSDFIIDGKCHASEEDFPRPSVSQCKPSLVTQTNPTFQRKSESTSSPICDVLISRRPKSTVVVVQRKNFTSVDGFSNAVEKQINEAFLHRNNSSTSCFNHKKSTTPVVNLLSFALETNPSTSKQKSINQPKNVKPAAPTVDLLSLPLETNPSTSERKSINQPKNIKPAAPTVDLLSLPLETSLSTSKPKSINQPKNIKSAAPMVDLLSLPLETSPSSKSKSINKPKNVKSPAPTVDLLSAHIQPSRFLRQPENKKSDARMFDLLSLPLEPNPSLSKPKSNNEKLPEKNICKHCSAQFDCEEALEEHQSVHVNERLNPFFCRECPSRFQSKKDLKAHKLIHTAGKINPLVPLRKTHKACPKVRRIGKQIECPKPKPLQKPFGCKLCLLQFPQKHLLRMHLKSHSYKRPFSCKQCPSSYKNAEGLRYHEMSHSGERPYSCDRCSAQFKNSACLKSHLISHTDERPFSCSQCDRQFKSKAAVRVHIITVHWTEKSFLCEKCSKQFQSQTHLTTHLLLDHSGRRFTCDHCAAQFKTKRDLKKHIKTHSEEGPFACEHCQGRFRHNRGLLHHLRREHNIDSFTFFSRRPFKQILTCDHCSKTFNRLRRLRNHRRIHYPERPYSCEQCHKTFKFSKYLKCHYRTHEKRFSCLQCSEQFRFLIGLKRHLPVHADEEPFLCKHCTKLFCSWPSLRTHLITFSKKSITYSCALCSAEFKMKKLIRQHIMKEHAEKTWMGQSRPSTPEVDTCPVQT